MTRNPGDTQWTDERLDAAYRGLADAAVTPDLARPVMAAIDAEAAPERLSMRRPFASRLRGPARALGGLAAAVAVVCLIGAALVIRGSTGTAANPSSRDTVESLPVMTVAQAVAAINAGNLASTDLLAVEGWLHGGLADLVSCVPPAGDPTPLEFTCGSGLLALTDTAGAGGTSLTPRVLDGFTAPDWMKASTGPSGSPEPPTKVILVGHVHDARAALCSPAAKAACEKVYVLDQVASRDDRGLSPSSSVFSGKSAPKPRMTPDQVLDKLAPVLANGSQAVSITAVTLLDAHQLFWPGLAPSGDGSQILWYVRVAGSPPVSPPMPGSGRGSGVLILDDASGIVRGGAGWGWDPSKAGTALGNGEVSLRTTNWLAGGACAGVGLDSALRGSATDSSVAWLENNLGATPRMAVTWPAGYRARFAPALEILDEQGKVVLREGDRIEGACFFDADTGAVYLEPPFK